MLLRIVLEREGCQKATKAEREMNENYVREMFSSISNKVFIQSIWTEECQINVAYYNRAGSAGVNFKVLIENMVADFPDINLISLELPGNIIKVHGLEVFEQTESSTKYKVFPLFFKKLATDDYYRGRIAYKKVVEISYELEQFDNVKDVFCSVVPIEVLAPGPVTIENAYNKLAQYLSKNIVMKNNIADKTCIGLEFNLTHDGNVELTLVHDLENATSLSIK